jgi:hypothetical protein
MFDFFPVFIFFVLLLFAFATQRGGKANPPPARWKMVLAVSGAVFVAVGVFAARFLLARP